MKGGVEMEDERIVELFLLRDEMAIARTSEKYGGRLQALAQHIVGDRMVAAECENDAYLAAWNAIPPHEPRSYLYAFLARITRHFALNCCRDQKRLKRQAHVAQLSAEMEACIPAPDDTAGQLDARELVRTLNDFLATLDEEKRNIFVRRYWYLDSVAQIAARYGISESKVKTTLHRTRNALRDYLEKEGILL